MSSEYYTLQDGNYIKLPGDPGNFKAFKKTVTQCLSNGYSSVFQAVPKEPIVYSVMRFEFDDDLGTNVIDEEAVGRLAFVHQQVISQIIPSASTSDLTCITMTHPKITCVDPNTGENEYIEEVFLFFPGVRCPIEGLINDFNNACRQYFNATGLHEQLDLSPINEIDSIMDPKLYQRPWILPGSYIDGQLLRISHIYERITEEQINDNTIISIPPEAYFSNYQIPDGTEYDIHNSFYFADLNGFNAIPRKKSQRERNRDHTSRMISDRQREDKRTSLEESEIYLGMIKPDRFSVSTERFRIGQVLYNIADGSQEGLELWKEFNNRKLKAFMSMYPTAESAASSLNITLEEFMKRIDEEDPVCLGIEVRMSDEELQEVTETVNESCEDEWNFMDMGDSTINTLKYWAKMDSPQEYRAFLKKDVTSLAWRCLNPTASHTEVAKLTHAMYSDQIVCANIRNKLWYAHMNHRWRELDGAHRLRRMISEEIPPIFEDILDEITYEYKRAISDEDKEKWATYIKRAEKLIKDLKTVGYKSQIVTECSEFFYDPDFINKLDENRTLVGLPNGVYDLETDSFRPGTPEDFVTITTKAKYNPLFHEDHPKIKEVEYYFKTVYPDDKLRHYVKKVFASILEGGNMHKDFYNMIGHGDNSKSMVAKALKNCLGGYVAKIPVALLMGKRGAADNATPHLADKKGIRALFAEEAPKGQSNVSVVKELSGNDDITARALFAMPITFSPQWKLFMWSNHMLMAEAEEKAYWNRQKVIDHESTFSFDAPENIEEQFEKKMFPRDPLFDQKVIGMADALFWCLTKWRKDLLAEGLRPPEKVLQSTNLAKLQNDQFLQYLRDNILQGDHNDVANVNEVYHDYRVWHNTSGCQHRMANFVEFRETMSKSGYLGINSDTHDTWRGIIIKSRAVQNSNLAPNNNNKPSSGRPDFRQPQPIQASGIQNFGDTFRT